MPAAAVDPRPDGRAGRSGRLRLGLLPRIALALAAVGLLPLGLAVWQLTAINRTAMSEQVLRSHTLAARATAARVEAFVRERAAMAATLAAGAVGRDPSSAATPELLTSHLQAFSPAGVLALAVLSPAGDELVRAQLRSAAARAAAAALAGWPHDERPRIVTAGGDRLLLLDRPGESGVTVRLIAAAGDLDTLLLPEELGEQAELVLVSADRQRLAGSPVGLDEWPPDFVDAALSGQVEGARRRLEASAGGSFVGSYAPVGELGWAVLSRQPARIAEATARRMQRGAAWVAAGAGALIAALAAAAWATLVRPLRRLLAAQRSLAGLFGGAARGDGDEVRQLERSFAALERGLRDRDSAAQVFLGRYQVLGVLGSGGMGTVFRGWDPKLERPVALKTVRLGEELGEGERERLAAGLLREAVTVARFQHPHIVAVYDAEQAPGGAFIAMELVEGKSLERLLWETGRLEPRHAVPLGVAIARALAAAHAHDLVHRDVKPANVLLSRDGAIKVTDFGIARSIAEALRPGGDQVLGTPGFIAPELLRGAAPGPQADLYALGVVLFAALAGALPAVARSGGPPPATVPAEPPLPADADALLVSLLAADTSLRPATAQEVADRLDAIARREGWRWELPEPRRAPPASRVSPFAPTQWMPTGRLRG